MLELCNIYNGSRFVVIQHNGVVRPVTKVVDGKSYQQCRQGDFVFSCAIQENNDKDPVIKVSTLYGRRLMSAPDFDRINLAAWRENEDIDRHAWHQAGVLPGVKKTQIIMKQNHDLMCWLEEGPGETLPQCTGWDGVNSELHLTYRANLRNLFFGLMHRIGILEIEGLITQILALGLDRLQESGLLSLKNRKTPFRMSGVECLAYPLTGQTIHRQVIYMTVDKPNIHLSDWNEFLHVAHNDTEFTGVFIFDYAVSFSLTQATSMLLPKYQVIHADMPALLSVNLDQPQVESVANPETDGNV